MLQDLTIAMDLPGVIGACLFQSDSGLMIMSVGGNQDLDLMHLSTLAHRMVRVEREGLKKLGLGPIISEIVITLGDQYHLICPIKSNADVFLCVALNRATSKLALARRHVDDLHARLVV